MVTVETALAVPVLLLVGAAAMVLPLLGGAQVRCTDAAREAALLVARGAPPVQAEAVARRLAPSSATVRLEKSSGLVRAEVRAPLGVNLLGRTWAVTLSGAAVAVAEP
jgi:Flp pilus assembly protein TadG